MSGASTVRPPPRRWPAIALAVIGVGLVLAPVAFQMFDRAPKGATMIKQFAPYMTTTRLAGYQRDIREIDAGVREGGTRVATALNGTGSAAGRRFEARFPNFAGFQAQWGPIRADMTHLLDTIQANVGNYDAVAALPSFTLFPWFFVIPGLLVLLALGAGLLVRRISWRATRTLLVVLGVGLVLAPVAFQMFDRAPKGRQMVDAFKTIETRHKVETIQGYFATIAVGQGAVRLELVPALRSHGFTSGQIATRFPAVTTLDDRWGAILNDLTPMIGTMSDNVVNYQAVAALPSFSLFPWFFVLPGLLIVCLAFAAQPRRARRASGPAEATATDSARSNPEPEGAL